MIRNLLLPGAGLRGVSYTGAVKALYELDIIDYIENICGVSAGSIVALLLCLELTYKELYALTMKVCSIEHLRTFDNEDIFKVYERYGVESGANIEKIIELILYSKTGRKACTFKLLHTAFPNKTLIIAGTNVSTNSTEYFNYTNTPDMEITTAIRISLSVPLIFTKVEYKNNIYTDGGVSCNIPIEYFTEDIDRTLVILLSDIPDYSEIDHFEKYLWRVFNLLISQGDKYIIHKYRKNIIEVVVHFNSFDIAGLDSNKKNELIDEAYSQFTRKFKESVFHPAYETIIIKDVMEQLITDVQ
tara:strand:- start:1407 stop:2309 length:903 start_codon:yes stop_codon:yes gene_type:complete